MFARSLVIVPAIIAFAVRCTEASLSPRIVNGFATDQYPAVAMIAFYSSPAQDELIGLCSGSLVGCRTVITAAHCVCPDNADTYASCQAQGIVPSGQIAVFLPHVGILEVESVSVHPNYEFGSGYDATVLRLGEPAAGVPPLQFARVKPAAGTLGRVVGYGTTRSGLRAVDDTGIKREGPIVFGPCPQDVPSDLNVCWNFTGMGSNTCSGDSGGAVLVTEDGTERLAGVVSGGSSIDCQAPDESFATAIAGVSGWIEATAADDVGAACASEGLLGDGTTFTRTYSVTLNSGSPQFEQQLELTSDTLELRATFNGQTGNAGGFLNRDNDFDLLLGHANGSSIDWVCRDERVENWGACRVSRPQPGTWIVKLLRSAGAGPAQLTVTIFRAPADCPGDCNGDGNVDVSEVVTAVNVLLGWTPVDLCRAADRNGDGEVTVDEIVQAVNAVLTGCPVATEQLG